MPIGLTIFLHLQVIRADNALNFFDMTVMQFSAIYNEGLT